MRKDLAGTDEALTLARTEFASARSLGGLAGMWPDDGRLISHELPPPRSFLGKQYAVCADQFG